MSDKEWKILIIDDDAQVLDALGTVFQAQGWNAVLAKDVMTGLELFRSEGPDLVLVACPDGIKGVEMIRELDAEVPIIGVASEESQEMANEFFTAGACDFAVKPFKAPDVVSRIRLHLRLLEINRRMKAKGAVRMPASKAKGIGAVTLALIQSAFRTNAEFLPVEIIAERTGLADQTAYRYLQHMASHELIEVRQNYGKVGRPKQEYRLKQPCGSA